MGVGGKKPAMKEIDETRSQARDEAFENIIEHIKSRGGEVTEDNTHPLYMDIGADQFEVGTERKVEFTLKNKMDFQLIRKKETSRIQGEGKQKHLEDMMPPRVTMVLKKRSLGSGDWQLVDMEDIF